jgi:hypothetical protein
MENISKVIFSKLYMTENLIRVKNETLLKAIAIVKPNEDLLSQDI